MNKTPIRWADYSWNTMTGCDHVSEGCLHCYAEKIANRFAGGKGFPKGFEPTFKPHKLAEPATTRAPGRVFVNSESDVHHEAFTTEQIDAVYDAMLATDRHDFLILTKRHQRMYHYLMGRDGWLARRGLDAVPSQIWLGTSIELDKYCFRADWLRRIPVVVRFLSCEPLLGPLPSLDLGGIGWVIAGGESGNGTKDFRPMDHAWARDLRDRCGVAEIPFFFKQSSGIHTETGIELDGQRIEEYPFVHPARKEPRVLGCYVDNPRWEVRI